MLHDLLHGGVGEKTLPPPVVCRESCLLSDYRAPCGQVAGGSVTEPSGIQPDILILGAGELPPGVDDVIPVAIPVDTQIVGQNQPPVILLKKILLLLLFDIGGHLKSFPRALWCLDKAEELQRLAPEIVGIPPDDIFLTACGPIADGREEGMGIGRGRLSGGTPEIRHNGLSRREPWESMGRDRKGGSPDILTEGEEMPVGFQIIDGLALPEVDLDLLDAGITLHVDEMTKGSKFVVHVVGTADIEGAVRLPVERFQIGKRHPYALDRILVARAVGPSPLKAVLLGKPRERGRSVGVIVGNVEGNRIVGVIQGVLDVGDFVPETLKSDDVVEVLPDDPGDGHTTHEPKDDDLFFLHDWVVGACPGISSGIWVAALWSRA